MIKKIKFSNLTNKKYEILDTNFVSDDINYVINFLLCNILNNNK